MELRSVLQNITPYLSDRKYLRQISSDWRDILSISDKEILNVLEQRYPEKYLLQSVIKAIQANDTYIIEQLLHEYTGYLPFSWYDLYNVAESDKMKQLLKAYKPPYNSSVLTPIPDYMFFYPEIRDIILYDDWDSYQRNKDDIIQTIRDHPLYTRNAYNRVVQDLLKNPGVLYFWQSEKEDPNPEQLNLAMQQYLKLRNNTGNKILLWHIIPDEPTYEKILSDLLDKYFNKDNAIDLIINISELDYGQDKIKQLTDHMDWFEYYMEQKSPQSKPKNMYATFWKQLLTSAIHAGLSYLANNIIEMEDVPNMDSNTKNKLKKFIKENYPIEDEEDIPDREELSAAVDGRSYD